MNIQALIDRILTGGDAAQVGHLFFSDRSRNENDTKEFITALLKSGAYEPLAAAMSSGCIDDDSRSEYIPNKKPLGRLSDRRFRTFMELVESSGVDMELVYPMMFAAFDAPKDSYLYSFVGGIDAFFTRFTYEDYDAAASVIHRYDGKLKCLSALMAADRQRTVELILTQLLYGKQVNKAAMRKYLLSKRADIVPELCSLYVGAKVKEKEAIVRLLLLYKSDPRAKEFLSYLENSENSLVVRKLLDKDCGRGSRKASSAFDASFLPKEIEIDGEKYEFVLSTDGKVSAVPDARKKEVTAHKKKIEKAFKAVIADCERAMEDNRRIPSSEFAERIKNDWIFAFTASSLLFSVYKNGIMSDIVVVENGEIRDLDNKKRELSADESVAVSHPAEWEYYEFLKTLDVKQPFEQIRRNAYVPTESERKYDFGIRVGGRVMPAEKFKTALKSGGFKLLNKNRYDESSSAGKTRCGFTCVIEFEPTNFKNPSKLVAMGKIYFYRYADLIKLGGQTYTEGVSVCPIRSVPAIIFSEFIRDVFAVLGA